jgi:hypothetical protein
VINRTDSTSLVSSKNVFSFQQGLSGKTVRLIADSCHHLKKLSLEGMSHIPGDDVVSAILKGGKPLTTLVLQGGSM